MATVKEILKDEKHYRAFSEVLKIMRDKKKIRYKEQGNTFIYDEKQLLAAYRQFLKMIY